METARGGEAKEGEDEEAGEGYLRPADNTNQLVSETAVGGEGKAPQRYGDCLQASQSAAAVRKG